MSLRNMNKEFFLKLKFISIYEILWNFLKKIKIMKLIDVTIRKIDHVHLLYSMTILLF